MSLPGLQLTAPVEVAAPTVHELQKGSEWRFEVAFGNNVEVKVCSAHPIPHYPTNDPHR